MMKRNLFFAICMVFILVLGSLTAAGAASLKEIDKLYRDQQYTECIAGCDTVLAEDAAELEAYYYKAMSYIYSGNLERAYDTLCEQLQANPKNRLALYNGACVASLLNKEEEAAALLERLFDLDITEKSAVAKDSDFDNIRDSEKYQELMQISVIFGGERLSFDVPPVIVEDRTLLPVRKIFEVFGAQVSYDGQTQMVTAKKDGLTIRLPIGNQIAYVNGEEKFLDVPAMILEDRTMVPVRFISEALNAQVEWDGENQAVHIVTAAPEGGGDYASVKQKLDGQAVVSVVDGAWPEPYSLPVTEGMSMIIFKDQEGLALFNSLSAGDRSRYVSETVYENYALVVGCDPVCAQVIYDGKAFYEGSFYYDAREELPLTYYEKGKPVNVVKQYKDIFSYRDFYLLPEEERTTSAIGDLPDGQTASENQDQMDNGNLPAAEARLKLGRQTLTLDASISCMDITQIDEGFPMLAGLSIYNQDGENVTADMSIERIWVVQGTQVEAQNIHEKMDGIDYAYHFIADWKPGSYADIIVEIKDAEGNVGCVKASQVKIMTLEESLQDLLGPGFQVEIQK